SFGGRTESPNPLREDAVGRHDRQRRRFGVACDFVDDAVVCCIATSPLRIRNEDSIVHSFGDILELVAVEDDGDPRSRTSRALLQRYDEFSRRAGAVTPPSVGA